MCWYVLLVSAVRRQKQGDYNFDASLGYLVRGCLKSSLSLPQKKNPEKQIVDRERERISKWQPGCHGQIDTTGSGWEEARKKRQQRSRYGGKRGQGKTWTETEREKE